jgi:hypothetical protein
MGLETIVATIYADSPKQLDAIGFNHARINKVKSYHGDYYTVEENYPPFDFEHSEAMRRALNFLARAKTKTGKNRSGLDTDISYRCDYSPVYD